MHSRICHLTLTDLLQELTVNSDSSHKPRGTHESPRLPETDADAFPWLASKQPLTAFIPSWAWLLTQSKALQSFLNQFRSTSVGIAYSRSNFPPSSSEPSLNRGTRSPVAGLFSCRATPSVSFRSAFGIAADWLSATLGEMLQRELHGDCRYRAHNVNPHTNPPVRRENTFGVGKSFWAIFSFLACCYALMRS